MNYTCPMPELSPLKIVNNIKTLVLLSVLITASCKDSEDITFLTISKLPSDSAIVIIEKEKDEVRWAQLCSQYLSNILAKTENDSLIKPVFNYLYQRSIRENSACGFNAFFRSKSITFITKGEIDSSLNYAYKAMGTLNTHDSIDPLHIYHILGLVHFYKDQKSDSVKYYWGKGFQLSKINKDNNMIMLFGTNLGTFFYNNGHFRTARNLFIEAQKASLELNRPNGILINNIINTFIEEGEFEDADKFWIANKKLLTANLNIYRGQLLLINRINLLQLLDRHNEAEEKLKMLHVDSVNPGLITHYARIYLDNKINKNDFSFANDSFWRKILIKNAPYLSSNLKKELVQNINRKELDFLFTELTKLATDTTKFKALNVNYQAVICELIANHLIAKDMAASIKYFQNSIKLRSNGRGEENKTQYKAIDELNDIKETFEEIKNREKIILAHKKTEQALIVALILVCIILILGFWITRNHLKFKNIEKARLQAEKEGLKREQELNNRIVEYSKSIIVRNNQLRDEILTLISTAPNRFKTSINQVLKDYRITSPNPDENPTIATQLIKENDKWNDQYPGFEKLNKTEQRVFVLTLENYRPKDVAIVLGVSTQYVRNVKSRLKSKFNYDINWDT